MAAANHKHQIEIIRPASGNNSRAQTESCELLRHRQATATGLPEAARPHTTRPQKT
ncbi:hypothetical protein BJX66DRAFT_306416 [Aspergillus keveii]|uniref:Uncharacterized protein n=1 Tax=Aspergillus keveii TaxID=714993 RepID=A0ABR4G2T2_9EURO